MESIRRDDYAAVRNILLCTIDKNMQQDPVTYFEAVKRIPEHTHYKAVDLIVERTETGITITGGTLDGKPQSTSATFDEIQEIINQQLEDERNNCMV